MNELPESEIIKAVALSPNAGKLRCKDLPSEPCICYDQVSDWAIVSYTEHEEDDHSKPLYEAASNVKACDSDALCSLMIMRGNCTIPEGESTAVCTPYCDSSHQAYYRVANDAFEAYCTRVVGYQQKTVKRLEEDSVKKLAYEAQKLADSQARNQKRNRAITLRARLKELASQDDLTAGEIKEALLKLLKLKSAQDELD
jgi:hypothetical protein